MAASHARAQPDAEPSAQVQAEYHAVVERAVAEFDSGHVAEARALFLRAHELWPSARTRRTLGMTAFELRMYPEALLELQAAMSDPRRPLPAEQRAQVAGLIEQTKVFVGSYRLQIAPAGAELLVDGTRTPSDATLVLGVGEHQLQARAPGYAELRRSLIVQGREDEVLALQLVASKSTPPSQPSTASRDSSIATSDTGHEPNHTPAILAFAVGGAGVVAGSVSGLIALSKKHDTDLAAGHRAADISTASWIVGGAGALAGVLFLALEPSGEKKELTLQPKLGPGTVQVEGRF